MKTVCKKLLCLMLVAMMLVSAIPFAFATDGEPETALFWIEIRVDGEGKTSKQFTMPVEPDAEAVIAYAMADAEYSAYFAEYANYEVQELAAGSAAINFTGAAEEPPVENPPVENPPAENPPAENPPAENPPAEDPADTYILSFEYLDKDGNWTGYDVEIENNSRIPLPTLPLVSGKDFLYWKDGDGNKITASTVWNIGESQNIIAVYESNTTEDGVVTLTVYANYYVEGVFHHREKLYTENFEETNKNTMFEWLYSDAGKKQTRDALKAEGYEGYDWAQVKYYNYYGDGEITEADMKTDGNKTVYIKVHSTDAIEANVMLYIHTKKTATVDRVIPMPGYTKGDYVTFADVKSAVKTKYSGSNMTISDLYSQSDWEDLLDGLNSTGAQSIKVETNGTTKIHVIVKNATSGGTADSSNPKTGDNIMIAVTTMTLAAVAMVAMVELKKKKMI